MRHRPGQTIGSASYRFGRSRSNFAFSIFAQAVSTISIADTSHADWSPIAPASGNIPSRHACARRTIAQSSSPQRLSGWTFSH